MNKKYIFSAIILVVLSLFTACEIASTAPQSQAPTEAPTKEPSFLKPNAILSFFATSDTHIGDQDTEESLRKTLKHFNTLDETPDAYLFAGDLTDTTGTTAENSQILKFKEIYEAESAPDASMLYCLGPTHDVPSADSGRTVRKLYRETFGDKYFSADIQENNLTNLGVRHISIKGFDFFSIDWEGSTNGGLSSIGKKYLNKELARINEESPEKPVFVMIHVPNVLSVNEILKNYPQVICLTGHLHNSLAREDSISQDNGYTKVHCGGTNYYRVDGYNRFTENPYLELGNIYQFAHGLHVQVDTDNNVTITRIDAYNGKIIGNPWEFKAGQTDVYTNQRILNAKKCAFTEDAKITVEKLSEGTLKVSFDAAKAGDLGPALSYTLKLTAKTADGYKQTFQADIGSKQVFFPNDDGIPELYLTYTFTGVTNTEDYEITVTARDCARNSENSLSYTASDFSRK